jgi:DNA-binding NarL/FixJ family response regulator
MPRPAANAAVSDSLPEGDGRLDDPGTDERTDREITDRQLEVLVQVARGRTNRQIGAAMGISERTVRNHLRSIGKRLAATDRTHAVVLAIGNGWIAVPIEPEPGAPMPSALAAESAS